MADRFVVLARDRRAYEAWCEEHGLDPLRDAIFPSDPQHLLDLDPRGVEIVLGPGYREHAAFGTPALGIVRQRVQDARGRPAHGWRRVADGVADGCSVAGIILAAIGFVALPLSTALSGAVSWIACGLLVVAVALSSGVREREANPEMESPE